MRLPHDFEVTRLGALVFDFVIGFFIAFVIAFELALAFVGALPPYVADAPSSSAMRRS